MTGGPIAGVVLKVLDGHADERGSFWELARASETGFGGFAQISWAVRKVGTITAWHIHPRQWDWWYVSHGLLTVVLHDLREGSATRGVTQEIRLGDGNQRVLAIPSGVAHGYKVIAGPVEILYVTSHEYDREHPAPPIGEEGRIPADDPAIGYDWSRA